MKPTKAFCVGFQKTGTSSMREAFELLGYRVHGVFGAELSFGELRGRFVQEALTRARLYDAVEDMPWPLVFRELDEAFPGSKFILTVRETGSWYKSISGHFGAGAAPMQELTYGKDAPNAVDHEKRYREVYEAHNHDVQEYFADRPNSLLVMDLAADDGWEKLCPFLDEPVPDAPFPKTNTAAQRKLLSQRIRKKLKRIGFPVKVMDR